MSLLQDPLKVVDQIEWYLDNQKLEQFPGAFLISAGSLCRHLLEQVLFILAFYSKMPRSKFLKKDLSLRTANEILLALKSENPETNKSYLDEARRCGPRIQKLARNSISLNKWRKEFNEPSHFRNPVIKKKITERTIQNYIARMRNILDPLDYHLIISITNELNTSGKLKAVLLNDEKNSPGIEIVNEVSPENFSVENSKLIFKSGGKPLRILPKDREESIMKYDMLLLQQGVGMTLLYRFVDEEGFPINIKNMQTIMQGFARTSSGRKRLKKRLNELGYEITFIDKTGEDIS